MGSAMKEGRHWAAGGRKGAHHADAAEVSLDDDRGRAVRGCLDFEPHFIYHRQQAPGCFDCPDQPARVFEDSTPSAACILVPIHIPDAEVELLIPEIHQVWRRFNCQILSAAGQQQKLEFTQQDAADATVSV